MAQSVVDICNSALQRLGAASIMSLTDNTREARACNNAYDSNRRDELRKHRWNFATKRTVLAPDSAAPAFDYRYQFTLPTDCLRVILPNDATLDWVVEGRKILTNAATSPYTGSGVATVQVTTSTPAVSLNLRYIADITDTTQFDASFYSMLSIALAVDMCEVLTNSTSKKQALMQEYDQCARDARRLDSFEDLPADPPDDTWWLARY